MKTFYTLLRGTHTFLLPVFLLVSIFAEAEDNSAGCLMIQTNIEERMLMTQGVIGQSFMPCEDGSLEHLTLFIESASSDTYGAQLSIYDGTTELTRQQFVIPAKGSEPRVQAWMAQPPNLESGKEYQIRVHVPEGKSFYAYYSSLNTYAQGNLRVNGLYMGGDLAFEAGVRLQEKPISTQQQHPDQQPCVQQQEFAQEKIAANLIEGQSFMVCEDASLDGIMLHYTAKTNVMGKASLWARGNEHMGPAAEFTFALSPAEYMTPMYLIPDAKAELEANTNYLLTFDGLAASSALPDNFELFCSSANTYAFGKLYSPILEKSKDLTFQLDLSAAEAADDDTVVYEFNGHPWHDCTISQPYWTAKRTFTGPTVITLEVPVCDDGTLEDIYLPGETKKSESIRYRVLNSGDRTIATGSLDDLDGHPGVLHADLNDKSVLFYFDYRIELTIAEGAELTLHVNTLENRDLPTYINGEKAASGVCYTVGMRPYTMTFTAVEEDRFAPELTAYPNPFTDQFRVRIDGLKGRKGKLTLYNLQGTPLWEQTIEDDTDNPVVRIQPETSLDRGYYTLRFEYEDQVILQTVICQ